MPDERMTAGIPTRILSSLANAKVLCRTGMTRSTVPRPLTSREKLAVMEKRDRLQAELDTARSVRDLSKNAERDKAEVIDAIATSASDTKSVITTAETNIIGKLDRFITQNGNRK